MTLQTQLSTLETSGLVRLAQVEPELEYLFKHALVQEAAYDSLLRQDRKQLHLRVAEILESLYPDLAATRDVAPVLGRHFANAGETTRAYKYYILAGEAALNDYANREAEQHFRSAESLAVSDTDQSQAMFGLGQALFNQGQFERAIEMFLTTAHRWQTLNNYEQVVECYARANRAAWQDGQINRTLQITADGLQIAAGLPDSVGLADFLRTAGSAYFFSGQHVKARPLIQQSIAIAERLGAVEVQARALSVAGILPGLPHAETVATLQKAIELAESVGAFTVMSTAYNNLADHHERAGRFRQSRTHYLKAAELAHHQLSAAELFCRVQAAGVSCWLGEFTEAEKILAQIEPLRQEAGLRGEGMVSEIHAWLARCRGELESALNLIRFLIQMMQSEGELQGVSFMGSLMLEALIEIENWAEAETLLITLNEVANNGMGFSQIWLLCLSSTVAIRQQRNSDAERYLTLARERRKETTQPFDQVAIELATARLAAAHRHWPQALTAYETATQLEAEMERRWYRAQTLREWAEAHLSRNESGDVDHARELLREALNEFDSMNVPIYAEKVRERLQTL